MPLKFGRFNFPTGRALVMGILNATPDSFSDGGQFASLDYAITHAEQMIRDGVDIIDIGGESSRPGAPAVPLDEELRRVMPLIFAEKRQLRQLAAGSWQLRAGS